MQIFVTAVSSTRTAREAVMLDLALQHVVAVQRGASSAPSQNTKKNLTCPAKSTSHSTRIRLALPLERQDSKVLIDHSPNNLNLSFDQVDRCKELIS